MFVVRIFQWLDYVFQNNNKGCYICSRTPLLLPSPSSVAALRKHTWIQSLPLPPTHKCPHNPPIYHQAYTHITRFHVYAPDGMMKGRQGSECVNKIRFSGLPGAGLDGHGGRYTNWIRLGLPMLPPPPVAESNTWTEWKMLLYNSESIIYIYICRR